MKIGYSMTQAELSVKYSRFLRLIVNDNATASSVLQSILDNTDGTNAKIFMQLLDIELHIHPLVAENVVKILDAAIATKAMPSRQKLLFSQRKIEFMEDFGPDISCIQNAKDDHEKLTEDVKKEAKDTEVKSEKAIETIEGMRFCTFFLNLLYSAYLRNTSLHLNIR